MHQFTVDGLREQGFTGYAPLLRLQPDTVPSRGGVYVVLYPSDDVPTFLDTSCGGQFKGRNPTVAGSALAAKWVDGCEIVYIGKANDLRKRLRQFRDFGLGRPVGHWGGRYIWQLPDPGLLTIAWRTTLEDPRSVESQMISAFHAQFGRLPFANLTS